MLNKRDTVYLKGIGILLIMFHNFFYKLDGAPGENEFAFSLMNFVNLIDNIVENPFDITKQLFSFFGHYGVQIFVFLSGYGLSITYEKQLSTFFSFIKKRWLKIFPLLLGAIMIYVFPKIFYVLLLKNDTHLAIELIKSSLLKLTLLSNFFPGKVLSICGPWWFFSLIFQLYLLFPILFRLRRNFLLIVIFFSWIIQLAVLSVDASYISYFRRNFIGHLPEFCLGIYFVKCKIEKIKPFVFLISILIFCLGCVNQYLWVFSFFTIPFIVIYLYQLVNINNSNKFHNIITYFGKNSMYLFAVHGFLIHILFALANKSTFFSVVSLFLYLLVSLFVALFLKFCLTIVDKKILKHNL